MKPILFRMKVQFGNQMLVIKAIPLDHPTLTTMDMDRTIILISNTQKSNKRIVTRAAFQIAESTSVSSRLTPTTTTPTSQISCAKFVIDYYLSLSPLRTRPIPPDLAASENGPKTGNRLAKFRGIYRPCLGCLNSLRSLTLALEPDPCVLLLHCIFIFQSEPILRWWNLICRILWSARGAVWIAEE